MSKKRLEIEDDRQWVLDIQSLMETEFGRRIVWRLLSQICGVFDATFSSDALVMAWKEGQREVGLRLIEEIQKYAPHDYARMIGERMQRIEEFNKAEKAREAKQREEIDG